MMLNQERTLRFSGSIVLVLVMAALLMGLNPLPVAAEENTGSDPLQFTSAGHILSFDSDGVMIASTNHLLKTGFIDASPVKPQSDNAGEDAGDFHKVTYNGLWNGVDLVYETSPGTVLKSTYLVAPNEIAKSVAQIRLQYNRPVSLDASGNLVTVFETGSLTESHPAAWQEVGGQKRAVQASYELYSDNEVGFTVEDYLPGLPLIIDPAITWNTFLGGVGWDELGDFTIDSSGNIYVTGYSDVTWGDPWLPFAGSKDAFVAKLDSTGTYQWHTFLGGDSDDEGMGITLDSDGNIYITGYSGATWGGSPLNAFTGIVDAFVAKLNSSGAFQWNTFLGGNSNSYGIAADSSNNIYVAGASDTGWGDPEQDYNGGPTDAFAAKLDSDGSLLWNTFLGSTGDEFGTSLAVDATSVYIAGVCGDTWGDPVRDYISNGDAFAAKLDSSDGSLTWNTFLGSNGSDYGYGIAVDGSGNVYVAGDGGATWGDPIQAYTGSQDAFAAKLDSSGALQWNTFLGGADTDFGYGIALDASNNVYMAGYSKADWGSATPAYSADYDAFAVRLDTNGTLTWNAFLGDTGIDRGKKITVDDSNNVYLAGQSTASWGDPLLDYTNSWDVYVAKLTNPSPEMQTTGNGNSITDGDATPAAADDTDFGDADVAGGTVDVTFTINNTGVVDMTLTGTPKVALSGANAADFSVTSQPVSPVNAAGNTTFTIQFNPSAAGVRSATVSIANNAGGSPFTFAIQGTGTGGGGASVGGTFTEVDRTILIAPLAILALAAAGGLFWILHRRQAS